MKFQRILIPVVAIAAMVLAYRLYGWTGVAAATSGLVMWVLLHFSRIMQVLKRTANRPVGYVDNAGDFNAKLKPGMTLLQVVAMTQALGELQSMRNAQPEVFRWADGSRSQVTCTFVGGELVQHELY